MATMADAPRPAILFADSFFHDRLCQHVDEVRFTEPVVITGCEVVGLHQSSLCPTLSLKGVTSPDSCAVEFFVRSGGESRFQPLGPSFIHSLAATSLLDVQAAVTEHLVLRGSYKSLTLVIYGNLAKELCLDRNRSAFVSSSKSTFNVDKLQEVLDTQLTAGSALCSLQLISPPTAEQGHLLHRFLQCLGGADPDRNLVSVLLMAAAALHVPLQISVNGAHWIAAKKLDPLDSPVDPVVDDVNVEVQELRDWVQQREEEGKQRSTEEGAEQSLLSISQTWLQAGLDSSCGLNTPLSAVESLVGGLAAVQLLCNKDPGDVQPFLAAGGMKLLLQVVEEVSETTGLLLFALTSVERACRHGCGCEALLSEGKEPLLALRHKMQRPPITRLLQRVVHRLQCYELACSFEVLVDQLTKLSASEDVVIIETATKLLNEFLESITASCVVDKDSAKADLVFTGLDLLTPTALGDTRFTNTLSDIDPALLFLLQEKCFMRTLAIFSSIPNIWTATGGSPNVYIEFAAVIQRLLLLLFSCRSGLLFLNGDLEAASTIISSLTSSSGQETQETEVSPIRHATVLTSLGFLRTPRDLAGMLQSRIAVMSAADRLVGADKGSEAAFWALWNLSTIARSEAGRQALLAVIWFPEVLMSLMVVLHPPPEFTQAMGEAAGHFAAEVLEKVFCDAALTNQTALTRHASALQMALQSACNIGMNSCSRILEWVEAAVVYEKKGAVGLLKHAAALIGPQSTSATMHVDSSMDDDANNRGAGAELPNSHSKGMMNALIQDSAVHALTISLKLLAPSAQNMGIAASLYGEGAMGVVTAILEHCLAALQASSTDDDEEDAEEEEGRGQEQDKERVLLALLLPTLMLLLSLLKRLQAVVQQYCSTRLLDLLLRIHHIVSVKEGAYGMVPPYSWSGGVLEVGAVQHVLASLLAFWAIFGWGPDLLPRLLGPNSTSLPVEPGEACSAICLLEECLPPECPRLLLNRAAVADLYRSVAAGSIYGEDVLSAVQWHTSPVNMEKILQALYPHLEQLGQLLLRLAPSSCDVVQERLTSLVTRLGCQSAEHAAILVRPVLFLLRQRTSPASRSALTEIDILQVERMLRWVASLALHPSSKAVLLQEDAVQLLVQALSSVLAPTLQPTVSRMGWLFWSCKAIAPLCDTSISFLPATTMDRHMAEDCPEYDDCCAIASSLFPFFQTMPMGKHIEILALALDKLGSHDLGRAALATVALGQPGITPSVTNEDLLESESSLVVYRDSLPWIKLWQNLAAALDSNEILNPVHVGLIRRFALAATVLSDSGQSAYGVVALKAMFGLIPVAETQGNMTAGEILQSLHQIMNILGQHIIELETSEPLSPVSINSLQEAHSAVSKMLAVLKEPAKEFNLSEEVDSLLGRLPAPRPVAERRAEALKSTSRWRIFSSEIPAEEIEPLDAELSDTASDVRGTIPWDCPRSLQETPGITMSMSKRRIISTIEVPGKRQRGEGGASALVSRTTIVPTSNRRDTFRQRKPNTSRPPSMHVDDYVAREKSSDAIPGTTSVTTTLQRSNSSMGRPPSIHVDEFLARQKDRQQPPAPTIAQPSVGNSGSRLAQDFPEPGEERHTLGLTASSFNVNQGMIEYSSMGVPAPGVPSTSASIPSPHNFSSADSVMPSGLSSGPGPQVQPINRPEHLQRSASSLTTAVSSEVTSFTSHRTDGVKKERSSGGLSPRVEIHTRSQSTSAVKVKLERAPSAKNTSVGPPPPPPPPHPHPHPHPHPQLPANAAGTSSVKKESRQQFERSNSGRPSPSGVAGGPSSSTASEQPPLSGMTGHPVPPPPPPPPPPPSSHSWLDPPRRLEPPLLHPAMPMMMPHMNVGPFNLGSAPRPPADLQVGGALLQSPGGMWHEPPSPFTSLPPPVLQGPSPMQQGPAYLHQPYVASRPVDMMQGFPVNHAGCASSSDRRFGSFNPLPGQGLPLPPPPPPPPPPPYQPPVPAGLPLVQNILDAQQSAHHPPPLHLQEAEISAQQEPGAVLQQILASPDTIQELLKDPKKLQQLLEQHPKLITLLQEKMSSGML